MHHLETSFVRAGRTMDTAAGEDIINGNRLADGSSDAQKRRIAYYYDRSHSLSCAYG